MIKLPGLAAVLGIVGLIALLSWLDERDLRAAEMERLEEIIAHDSECSPTIELSMPIDPAHLKT